MGIAEGSDCYNFLHNKRHRGDRQTAPCGVDTDTGMERQAFVAGKRVSDPVKVLNVGVIIDPATENDAPAYRFSFS